MKKKYFPILTLITILLSFNVACLLSGGGTTPPRAIPVSPTSARQLEDAFTNPTLDATTSIATVRLTEEQITSYAALQLQKDTTSVIQNPQVFLENDQVTVYGRIVSDAVSADGKIVMTITLDDQGLPVVKVVGEFGPLPVPSFLADEITKMVDNMIKQNISPNSVDYRIQSITIADHALVISFKPK